MEGEVRGGIGDGVSAVGSMAGRQMGTTDYALVPQSFPYQG